MTDAERINQLKQELAISALTLCREQRDKAEQELAEARLQIEQQTNVYLAAKGELVEARKDNARLKEALSRWTGLSAYEKERTRAEKSEQERDEVCRRISAIEEHAHLEIFDRDKRIEEMAEVVEAARIEFGPGVHSHKRLADALIKLDGKEKP